MAKTVFDVLIENIDEQVSSAETFLSGGSAKEYAEYREIVGLIRGLNACKTFVQDLSRNFMEDDDD
jgi:hypothetical protein